jgi:phage gp37-like protein
MKRTDVEQGLIELIQATSLRQELRTLEIYDQTMIDAKGDLVVVMPAVLLVPGTQEFLKADVSGYTYEQDMFFNLLVAASNYRSAAARRQGGLGAIGVNEMLDILRDGLRGLNPIPSIYAGARIFLVREDPQPELGPACVYSLTFRVGGFMEKV